MSDQTSRRNPLIYLAALLLAGICITALLVINSSEEPPVVLPAPAPVDPVAKPVTKLNLQVTGCSKMFGYTQISGLVKNTGEVAVRFVSVTTVWRDANNRRVDYGTIFVVGDEGLQPGESASFQDSSHHAEARKCGAQLEDWWSHSRE